jgi:transcriptional regulator with XRE-family HTH domain
VTASLRRLLGQNLQRAREAAGLTQLDVAEHFVINKATVSAWETSRGVPDALRLHALARLYGTSMEALFQPREGSS